MSVISCSSPPRVRRALALRLPSAGADRPGLDAMETKHTDTKPAWPAVARWEVIAIIAVIAVAAILRLVRLDLSYFNLHVGRDLYRALQILHYDQIHLLGSEMQYGGRVFGPLVYLLYAIPLAITKSPIGVGVFIGLVNTALVGWLWAFGRTRFGPGAAVVGALLYATFPIEIVQLRYLWNPCFLPLMVMGMYYSLARWAEGGCEWWLVGIVTFFTFGFQLHFSVLMTLPFLAGLMWLARRRPSMRIVGIAVGVLLFLFAPFLWAEFRLRVANAEEAVKASVARPSLWERHQPNPTTWINLRHVVTFDWNEEPARLGFTYLWFLREDFEQSHPTLFPAVWALALGATLLHAVLWLAGMRTLLGRALAWKRGALGRREGFHAVLLVAWQFAPIPFLTFFNYHQMSVAGMTSLVPIRYYLVTFPITFLIAGVGFDTLRSALASPASRRMFLAVPALLGLFYAGLAAAHLRLVDRTGIALPYLYFHAPSLGRMLELREYLLGDLKMNIDDYYDRTTTQNVFRPGTGEATMDFLITQDPRAYSNAGLGADKQVVIWAPSFPSPAGPPPPDTLALKVPAAPDGTPRQELSLHRVGLLEIRVYEGAPSGTDPFDPREKRNYYYRDQRMKFLDW